MSYCFRYFKDKRNYFECDSFDELRHELRAYTPCNTVFRAINTGRGRYTVLKFSPYTYGPAIEGYLTTPDCVG